MARTNFIGYATLEKLADVIDVQRPVYASCVQNPGRMDKYGMYICRAEIVVEQPDERGDVHYCLIPMGRYTVMPHVPEFDLNKPNIIALQRQAFQLVNDWLGDVMGFNVREAQISKPENLRMLEGWFEALVYDKAHESFRLKYPTQVVSDQAEEVGELSVTAG